MKKNIFLPIIIILLVGCAIEKKQIDISGDWQFRTDSLNAGVENKWFSDEFEEIINLPGSMAENKFGDQVGKIPNGWEVLPILIGIKIQIINRISKRKSFYFHFG